MISYDPAMPNPISRPPHALSDWDRDAALTTARILLEIKAVNFRPEEPYTFTSGWKSPVYIDCRQDHLFPARPRSKICDLARGEDPAVMSVTRSIETVAGGETAGIPFAAFIADRMHGADVLRSQEAEGLWPAMP